MICFIRLAFIVFLVGTTTACFYRTPLDTDKDFTANSDIGLLAISHPRIHKKSAITLRKLDSETGRFTGDHHYFYTCEDCLPEGNAIYLQNDQGPDYHLMALKPGIYSVIQVSESVKPNINLNRREVTLYCFSGAFEAFEVKAGVVNTLNLNRGRVSDSSRLVEKLTYQNNADWVKSRFEKAQVKALLFLERNSCSAIGSKDKPVMVLENFD
jgi:hypothetical protein